MDKQVAYMHQVEKNTDILESVKNTDLCSGS